MQCTGAPTYTTTHMNKNVNVDKIKHTCIYIYLLYWYFNQNLCLNIKKHSVHNIHRFAWGPWTTSQHAHALRWHWIQDQI
jgi:hypothetical protein